MGPCKCFVLVAVTVLSACGSVYSANATAAGVEESKIIGGKKIDIKEAPFTVQTYESLGNSEYKTCGGSVIGKVHVLTAGHCVKGTLPSKLFVVYSSSVFNPNTKNKRGVKKIHVHPHYQLIKGSDGKSASSWDVAVLLVDGTIPVTPIKVAPYSFRHIPAGKIMTIVGWGQLTASAVYGSNYLYSSTFPVLSHLECRKRLTTRYLEDSEFCVTSTTSHSQCRGDSGGPVYDSTTNTQYGVVSWSECGANGFGVEVDLTDESISEFLIPFIPSTHH